jgi:hypothetical protein
MVGLQCDVDAVAAVVPIGTSASAAQTPIATRMLRRREVGEFVRWFMRVPVCALLVDDVEVGPCQPVAGWAATMWRVTRHR